MASNIYINELYNTLNIKFDNNIPKGCFFIGVNINSHSFNKSVSFSNISITNYNYNENNVLLLSLNSYPKPMYIELVNNNDANYIDLTISAFISTNYNEVIDNTIYFTLNTVTNTVYSISYLHANINVSNEVNNTTALYKAYIRSKNKIIINNIKPIYDIIDNLVDNKMVCINMWSRSYEARTDYWCIPRALTNIDNACANIDRSNFPISYIIAALSDCIKQNIAEHYFYIFIYQGDLVITAYKGLYNILFFLKHNMQVLLLKEEVDALKLKLEQRDATIIELKTENAQLKTENKELKARIIELETENVKLKARIVELETENKELKARIKELETENKELKARIKYLEDEIVKRDLIIAEQAKEIALLKQQLKERDDRIRQLEEDNKELRQIIGQQNVKIKNQNKKIQEQDKKLQEQAKTLQEQSKKIQEQDKHIHNLEIKIDSLTKLIEHILNTRFSNDDLVLLDNTDLSYEAKYKTVSRMFIETENRKLEADIEIAKLQTKIESLRKYNDIITSKYKELLKIQSIDATLLTKTMNECLNKVLSNETINKTETEITNKITSETITADYNC